MTDTLIAPDAFTGFLPWVGPLYGKSPDRPRVLILGESHWGPQEWRRSTFTQEVVQHHVFERRSRFFTKIAKLVYGMGTGTYLSTQQYHDFWNGVVFWNFVQDLAGPGPRHRPSEEKWATGRAAFRDVLEVHRPDVVIALGKELWTNLPAADREESRTDSEGRPFDIRVFVTADGHMASAAFVNHPSSRGWRYDAWQPRVAQVLSTREA